MVRDNVFAVCPAASLASRISWALRPRASRNDRSAPRLTSSAATSVGAPCQAAWCRGVNQAGPPGRHWLTFTRWPGLSSRRITVDQSPALAASASR